ncbi:DUF2304 domain-containing protein [Bacillus massiliigorillae]|uniref:DUF2304 domain-containing protein n=1 Tax=Bacillus massiliigorillae TaxID=1243664 RepID=UPI00039E82D8|nr:DUF2304 domain-containing protein [Bacillus massiliigorillae]
MNIYILSIIIMFFVYVIIWKSVKRGRLGVRDSILWILLSLGMGLLVWQYKWLDWIADKFHVGYAPSLLFLLAIILCLMFILDLTMRLNKLQKEHVILVQKIALMESEWKEKE